MATIDILAIVDTETILSTNGANSDPQKPTNASPGTVYLVTQQGKAMSGINSGSLKLSAEIGDEIRWQVVSATLSSEYTVLLYGFEEAEGGDLLSPPQEVATQAQTPLPNLQDPLHPTTQTIEVYYWSSTVKQPGSATYGFNFMILDRHNAIKGYYAWNIAIEISSHTRADGITVALQSDIGNFMALCNGCIPNSTEPGSILVSVPEDALAKSPQALFTIQKLSNGKYALQASNGNYIARCNACIPGAAYPDSIFAFVSPDTLMQTPAAQFALQRLENGKYALQADSGNYVARCNECMPEVTSADGVFVHTPPDELMNSPYAQWNVMIIP